MELGVTVNFLDHNLIEYIPLDGYELSVTHVNDLHSLIEHQNKGVGLLINKQNNFSWSFEALSLLAQHEGIAAIAIFTERPVSLQVSKYETTMIERYQVVTDIFQCKDAAMAWLRQQLA